MIFRRTLTPWKRPKVLKQKSKKSLNFYGRITGRISIGPRFGIRKHEPTFNMQSDTMNEKSVNKHPYRI